MLSAVAAFVYLPGSFDEFPDLNPEIAELGLSTSPPLLATVAVLIGIVLAAIILWITGYYTGTEHKPVQDVARTSLTGDATVILSGISVGYESAVYTALIIAGAVYSAFLLGGGSVVLSLFLIALAGTGLLTTVGVIVAMDTFGPVSDNAQGIAEMSGDVDEEGAKILTELDAVGNTTKAITKGIAIATAVLAATALFGSYNDSILTALTSVGESVDVYTRNVDVPNILVGIIIGAAVVFMFSGLAINAVGRAAGAVVYEVRRQFKTMPGIMDGTQRPEYGRVVDICTRDSLQELVDARPAGRAHADRGRVRPRCRTARRLPGRSDRRRRPDGGVPGQLRWCLGQRQEDGRGRPVRREGLTGPLRHGDRRHRR